MALRRPDAHLRRPSAMRRSGDQSYWDSLMSEGEPGHICFPSHGRRPQSAIEGGQLDGWLEQLYRMQSNQISGLSSRTSSTTTLDREPSGFTARQQMTSSFKRGSYSCGTPSHCASSLGSQESLQTGSPVGRRGSWERVHIAEAPNKEQTQLSDISPVKIGWLPIQRRVMRVSGVSNQNQSSDPSSSQVKLKQPITPTLRLGCATNSICQGREAERSHSRQSVAGGRTWLTPDQGSTIIKQVPVKQGSTYEVNKPVGWQALKRGWKISRQPSVPTASPATASNSDQQKVHQQTANKHLPQPPGSPESQATIHRTSCGQPLRATGPVCASNSGSAVTTIIPQSKGSFSSITISSRKVSRSASLPGSDSSNYTNSDSRKITMQRNATIVKVTENRMIEERVPPFNALDTVVQKRKATIIKVTEHRESYGPTSARTGTRPTAYRHSYTEGSQNNIRSSSAQYSAIPYRRADSAEKSSDAVMPYSSGLVKNGDEMHTSTISVFVNNPPAITAPESEVTLRPKRSARPVSCYSNVFEPKAEHVEPPPVRKWSFEIPNNTYTESPARGFVRPRMSGKEASLATDPTLNSKKDKLILPQRDEVLNGSSSNMTPVKAPDPQTPQSPEDVLAHNAAAVIANIKQLSSQRKKTNISERVSNAPRGNIVTHEGKCVKIQQRQVQKRLPLAAFVPLNPESSGETFSLQDALRRSRPHFITRSQTRVQKVERRAQERRERVKLAKPQRKRDRHARTAALHAQLHKPTEATVKPDQFTSTWTRGDSKKKSGNEEEEEKKKNEPLLTSRQRIELFKKRLWDQLLQRSNK